MCTQTFSVRRKPPSVLLHVFDCSLWASDVPLTGTMWHVHDCSRLQADFGAFLKAPAECAPPPLCPVGHTDRFFSPHRMGMYSMLNCKVVAEIVRRNDNNVTAHTSLSLQIGLMSVTVFPVRLLLVSFFMLLAWPFAFTASLGRSEFVVEPQSWWRRCVFQDLKCYSEIKWVAMLRDKAKLILITKPPLIYEPLLLLLPLL